MGEKKNVVLFVDDEPHILSAIRRVVIDEPFHSLFANSGKEALQIFEEQEISVIVTDMRMPVMDGLTLLKIICEKYPKTVQIVLSGYTQLSQVLATVNLTNIFQFIAKPWQNEEEILLAVNQAITRYELEVERDFLRVGLARRNQAYQKMFIEMEGKFSSEKRDLANLKRTNYWIFRFWKKQLEMNTGQSGEGKDAIARIVDTIEDIQFMYLEILPIIAENKNISTIVDDIKKGCGERITIQGLGNHDLSLLGYHTFLVMVFKILIHLICQKSNQASNCDMTLYNNIEGHLIVNFDISIPATSLVMDNQNKLKIACSFLNEISKIYNIKIVMQVKNNEIVSLQVIWKSDTNEKVESNS